MKKRKISWRKVDSLCKKLCKKVENDIGTVDTIVGVSRGGLIPAILCAKLLNVREVLSFGLKSYNDDDDYMTREPIPTIYQDIMKSESFCTPRTTLIVDDISDKGNTFQFINDYVESKCPDKIPYMYTASLFIKPDTEYIPTWFADVNYDGKWLLFPWES